MERFVPCAAGIRVSNCGHEAWLEQRRSVCLAIAIVCLLGSLYFAAVIAPAGLGAHAPTVQQGLFPAWFGSREILLHGRDPYSATTTREIQIAIYGMLAGADSHTLNQHRFAYPVFFAFLFSPLAVLPFWAAQSLALAACIAATALSVLLWMASDGQRLASWIGGMFVFASYPVVLGLQLRQPTLIVAALLAVTVYCIRSNRLALAGLLAAFSLCKPQIAIAVVLPLTIWSIANWNTRKRFLAAMAVGLTGLLSASEWVSPGWSMHWIWTLKAYPQYVGTKPLLVDLLRGHFFLPASLALIGAVVLVSYRHCDQDLRFAISFSIAAFQLLFPFQIYNEILLIPVALWMARNADQIQNRGQLLTLFYACTWIVLAAGWGAAIGLSLTWLIAPGAGLTLWYLPLVMAWLYPFPVFVTLALYAAPSSWLFRKTKPVVSQLA